MNRILISLTLSLLVCGCRTNAADSHPLLNGKSPESCFILGAWTGYVSSLGTNQDSRTQYTVKIVRQFQMLQGGTCENPHSYLLFRQESSDTPEHTAIFRQIEDVAMVIENAFIAKFHRPTLMAGYKGIERPTSEGIRHPGDGSPKPSK